MYEKFRQILHDYKVNAFKVSHNGDVAQHFKDECAQAVKEILTNDYHYHFHTEPDGNRAEVVNLINNYALEALLPPILEKMVTRQMTLERKQEMIINLLERILEILSQDPRSYSQTE